MLDRATVLVVDDTPDNLSLMHGLLRQDYRVRVANHGEKALRIVQEEPPDLILLDVMMPELDGYEVCRRIKAMPEARELPIIFLTAKSQVADEELGFSLGAVDYITKPISPPIVLARVRTHLLLKRSHDFLRDKAAYLEAEVARRSAELAAIQDVTILAMASLAETRDNDTGNHIRRTQHYVRVLALALQRHPDYAAELSDTMVDLLYKSAPLHDIGKVGIPDHILLKPGPFVDDEFEHMKSHARLGRDAIEAAERQLGRPVPFLRVAKEIAYSHQEKWDGSGYPEGLRGTAIPLGARLMALADVYDALISRRCYKAPMTHAQAAAILRAGRGSHFDPAVVDAFDATEAEFERIAAQYSD
ncbi:putative two-component system response regulator [Inhella inkyongensis]|uniref:Putative two-component system response regulator n=1 Tax=Inhella inkyongensis TaxID=392593 RepID=A0A840SCJ9_9BURK|nr:two-component system response regulator [Inhella inkyongensis]MBB5206070.1 putative two-component system response regulator [Inhella inkyongensis]